RYHQRSTSVLGRSLHSSGGRDASPVHGEAEPPPPADGPNDYAPGIDSYPDPQLAAVAPADQTDDLEPGRHRTIRMVGKTVGRPEHRQQPIADELVGMPAVAEDHGHHFLVEAIQAGHHLAGRSLLGVRR